MNRIEITLIKILITQSYSTHCQESKDDLNCKNEIRNIQKRQSKKNLFINIVIILK